MVVSGALVLPRGLRLLPLSVLVSELSVLAFVRKGDVSQLNLIPSFQVPVRRLFQVFRWHVGSKWSVDIERKYSYAGDITWFTPPPHSWSTISGKASPRAFNPPVGGRWKNLRVSERALRGGLRFLLWSLSVSACCLPLCGCSKLRPLSAIVPPFLYLAFTCRKYELFQEPIPLLALRVKVPRQWIHFHGVSWRQ